MATGMHISESAIGVMPPCSTVFLIYMHIISVTGVLKTREILPVVLRATYPKNQVALTKSM